jgi:putative RecB family exonuclease
VESDVSTKYSPSKLDTYKNCPRRYQYRYVDKISRQRRTVEAYLGTCVHTAFEELYEGLMHGKTLTLEETTAAFETAWDKDWSKDIEIRGTYAPADWKALGKDCVRHYYEANKPFDKDRTVAVEKRIGFPLTVGEQEIRIEGFIDRLALGQDGLFEIHDYKTGKTLPAQADVDEDWQLALYDAAVRSEWPDAKGVRLVWHYVRHGKALVSTRTVEQLAALKEEVKALVATIKTDHEFKPRQTALCDWCEYKDLCPLYAHAERLSCLPPAERTSEAGARLAGELAALEADKRALRDKVREIEKEEGKVREAIIQYAEANGLSVVSGPEGDAVVSIKDELKFPTKTNQPEQHDELEKALKGSPLWPAVSSLDSHKLADGYKAKKWPDAWRLLAEELIGRYAKRAVEKTVRFRRKKADDDD